MNPLIIIAIITICVIGVVLGSTYFQKETSEWVEIKNSGSIFRVFVTQEHFDMLIRGLSFSATMKLELNPENNLLYEEISYDTTQNAIVILPTFTASAYSEAGFYDYYTNECDESCLTIPLKPNWKFTSNIMTIQALNLLGYPLTDDYEVSKNPEMLNQYDTIILLHNEYVTKAEFDAITNHPNVVYLYPNALYAEVNLNSDDTITLIRGHNYPTKDIKNGFDWKFDNSPLEYDTDCNDLKFYEIDNGVMLNCYPERGIDLNPFLLKLLKDY